MSLEKGPFSKEISPSNHQFQWIFAFFFGGGGKSCYFGFSARFSGTILYIHVPRWGPTARCVVLGGWIHTYPDSYLSWSFCLSGPFKKLHDRLKAFSCPTLSIIERCTSFNTLILSVMPLFTFNREMRRASCACHEFDGVEMWIHDPTTHGRSCLAVAIAVLEGCRGAAIKQRHDEILNLAVGLCQHELCCISVAAEDWLPDNRINASPIGSWMAQSTIISVCTVLNSCKSQVKKKLVKVKKLPPPQKTREADYIRPKGLFGALEHDFWRWVCWCNCEPWPGVSTHFLGPMVDPSPHAHCHNLCRSRRRWHTNSEVCMRMPDANWIGQ